MQAENNTGVKFAPNRSKKTLLPFYFAFGLVMVGGLSAFTMGLVDSEFESWNFDDKAGAGALLFGTALVFFLMVHFLTSPPNISYHVSKGGLVLKQGKKILSIPYSDIESITHLKEKQAEDFILQLQHKMIEKQRESLSGALQARNELNAGGIFGGITNAFKEQKRAFEKYKFLSVAIGYSSSGNQRGPQKATRADLPCDTIFILQKNGQGYLISPLDIEGFMREANKHALS